MTQVTEMFSFRYNMLHFEAYSVFFFLSLLSFTALLYPGDKPHRRIRKRIAIPGPGLLSCHFADPPAPPENPDDDLDFDKVFYNNDGEPVMEIKHSFPKAEDVKPNVEMQNLPTGKALVRSKINSWLTFEDYVRLTR